MTDFDRHYKLYVNIGNCESCLDTSGLMLLLLPMAC